MFYVRKTKLKKTQYLNTTFITQTTSEKDVKNLGTAAASCKKITGSGIHSSKSHNGHEMTLLPVSLAIKLYPL
jgi:hypothetical protein